MDYHLDWLHASLFLSQPGNNADCVHSNVDSVATGTQEDIDLLIAVRSENSIHFFLLKQKQPPPGLIPNLFQKQGNLEISLATILSINSLGLPPIFA